MGIQQNPTKSNKIEIDNNDPTKWVCEDQKYKFIVLQDSESMLIIQPLLEIFKIIQCFDIQIALLISELHSH